MAVIKPIPKKKPLKKKPVKKVATKRLVEAKKKAKPRVTSGAKTSSGKPKRRAAKRLTGAQRNKAIIAERKRKAERTPDYDFIHKRNIITEVRTPKVKVEAGSIIRFSYRGIDVHEPRPLVLVLHPR